MPRRPGLVVLALVCCGGRGAVGRWSFRRTESRDNGRGDGKAAKRGDMVISISQLHGNATRASGSNASSMPLPPPPWHANGEEENGALEGPYSRKPPLPFYDPEDIEIVARLGYGKFSDVFLARLLHPLLPFDANGPTFTHPTTAPSALVTSNGATTTTTTPPPPPPHTPAHTALNHGTVGSGGVEDVGEAHVALKVLRPVPPWRIHREVSVMCRVSGGPNIVRLYGTTHTFRHALILELVSPTARPLAHGDEALTDTDIRHYVYEVLRALEHAHVRCGVMHRDVKNRNVLIDARARTLRLVDWGSADVYHPGRANNVYVSTRFFKAPELLVGYPYYDYAIDMWGVGCILAGLIFKREPLFRGVDDDDQLKRIVKVLGTEGLDSFCAKCRVELEDDLKAKLGRHSRKRWNKFVNRRNAHLCSPDALDLLDKLLRYDHDERLTATEALAHPYFNPIRQKHHTPHTHTDPQQQQTHTNPLAPSHTHECAPSHRDHSSAWSFFQRGSSGRG